LAAASINIIMLVTNVKNKMRLISSLPVVPEPTKLYRVVTIQANSLCFGYT
jgi:hypothetical protein